ncbi:MAG: RNA 2',3'-cyclic phosphodiesterase [Nitrospinae bacterium]|nr:RNA 2',3'-cyclic phosphodiesterase [Nitrospinota bacterium]
MRDAAGSARLFIAVKIPPELAQSLDAVIRQLAAAGAEVKWVKTKNLHLTLKFLGEVDAAEISPLIAALQTIKSENFDIEVGSIGVLPNMRRPRVIYADVVQGAEKLTKLAILVEKVTVSLGFTPENRHFLAHLTLGRFKGFAHLNRLAEKIDGAKGVIFGKLSVEAIYLIKSELLPDGPRYTELAAIPLE